MLSQNLINLSFVFLFSTIFAKSTEMKIIPFFTDIFKFDVPTEYYAFQLLQKKTLNTSSHYLAVPWTPLINKNQLSKIPRKKLSNIKNGFTICQHILYEKLFRY